MSQIGTINDTVWEEWLSTRPVVIQELCYKLPPDKLYRIKSTGHRVTIVSYSEDGTVKVAVGADFNCVVFERHVFGLRPEDLEECDFPAEGEPTGTLLTDQSDIDEFCAQVRSTLQNG